MDPNETISDHFRIDRVRQKALSRLNLHTIHDLVYHLPSRYEDIADIQAVDNLEKGQDVVVYGKIGGLKSRRAWKSKKPIAEGWIEDGTARIKVMWFNQPYLAKMITDGTNVKLAGKVTGNEGKLYIANPEIKKLDALPVDQHDSIFKNAENIDETIYPIYHESKGVTSKWFYHAVLKCFEKGILEKLNDPIPKAILDTYKLPTLTTALQWIHTPKKAEHAQSARKRFAFEEVFYIQIQKARGRSEANAATTYTFKTEKKHIDDFTSRFGFELTGAQKRAIKEVLDDFSGSHAMSRLLEGDVGSGKTAVAATTAYAVATSRPPEGLGKKLEFGGLQVAYMAPTEILAKQHFENFIEFFHHLPIQIGLITGSGCMKFPSKVDGAKPTNISRAQLLKWVKNGEIPILIGTHALIYKSVEFKHLAHVIIDEQHRFGTNQRKALAKKSAPPTSSSNDIGSSPASQATGRIGTQVPILPHLLSMTATPIPRTLALTVYGDLDITLLDEMPKGRKPIITEIVTSQNQKQMYDHIKKELQNGRQAYVICPRIEEPDEEKANALRVKSVEAEAARLKKDIFKEANIAVLHGKMKPKEKDETMQKFLRRDIDILVATSVVEVGVNVENATNIIIEGAERFGLAQLHQLRGRVLRSNYQAYCFAVTESKSEKTRERLKALKTAKNGFELAEYDLTFRGSGELYGIKQSGLTDLGMEALRNIKLVEAARKEAQKLVKNDPKLKKYPLIQERIQALSETLHME